MGKSYVGDVGTIVLLDTGVDISTASAVTIEVKKPDGTLVSWVAAVSATNKVRYVVGANDFDIAGNWQMQPKVVMPTGLWYGETVKVRIYDRFK